MAVANNNGWDFVKTNGIYQYKEGGWIAKVQIMEDNSNEDEYYFVVKVLESSWDLKSSKFSFDLIYPKDSSGYFSGMSNLYEKDEYFCNYIWKTNEVS